MATSVKTEPKDSNLVTSSMMLVNNPVTENMVSYYQDSMGNTSSSRCPPTAQEEYVYHESYASNMGPFSYGTYFPYSYSARPDHVITSRRNCSCAPIPPQQSLLHQILMGKGYKNDKMFIPPRPAIKQERDYGDYGCCYGYGYHMGYGYPFYQ